MSGVQFTEPEPTPPPNSFMKRISRTFAKPLSTFLPTPPNSPETSHEPLPIPIIDLGVNAPPTPPESPESDLLALETERILQEREDEVLWFGGGVSSGLSHVLEDGEVEIEMEMDKVDLDSTFVGVPWRDKGKQVEIIPDVQQDHGWNENEEWDGYEEVLATSRYESNGGDYRNMPWSAGEYSRSYDAYCELHRRYYDFVLESQAFEQWQKWHRKLDRRIRKQKEYELEFERRFGYKWDGEYDFYEHPRNDYSFNYYGRSQRDDYHYNDNQYNYNQYRHERHESGEFYKTAYAPEDDLLGESRVVECFPEDDSQIQTLSKSKSAYF